MNLDPRVSENATVCGAYFGWKRFGSGIQAQPCLIRPQRPQCDVAKPQG